jgi:hypothetical protein
MGPPKFQRRPWGYIELGRPNLRSMRTSVTHRLHPPEAGIFKSYIHMIITWQERGKFLLVSLSCMQSGGRTYIPSEYRSGSVRSKTFTNAPPTAFASYLQVSRRWESTWSCNFSQLRLRELLIVHLVRTGFAPGQRICLATPHRKMHWRETPTLPHNT